MTETGQTGLLSQFAERGFDISMTERGIGQNIDARIAKAKLAEERFREEREGLEAIKAAREVADVKTERRSRKLRC